MSARPHTRHRQPPVVVYIDPDIKQAFKRLSGERDRSMASQARDLIRTFVEHAEQQPGVDPAVDSAARQVAAAR